MLSRLCVAPLALSSRSLRVAAPCAVRTIAIRNNATHNTTTNNANVGTASVAPDTPPRPLPAESHETRAAFKHDNDAWQDPDWWKNEAKQSLADRRPRAGLVREYARLTSYAWAVVGIGFVGTWFLIHRLQSKQREEQQQRQQQQQQQQQ
jgi:hypothetical protein